ncbi:hypothetical protein PENSPDRAFT_695017 [Peniophora sp. CONT]|nr:hypothetical protein PENSPDRAFT_695017 [Peniophora sp. CONT]
MAHRTPDADGFVTPYPRRSTSPSGAARASASPRTRSRSPTPATDDATPKKRDTVAANINENGDAAKRAKPASPASSSMSLDSEAVHAAAPGSYATVTRTGRSPVRQPGEVPSTPLSPHARAPAAASTPLTQVANAPQGATQQSSNDNSLMAEDAEPYDDPYSPVNEPFVCYLPDTAPLYLRNMSQAIFSRIEAVQSAEIKRWLVERPQGALFVLPIDHGVASTPSEANHEAECLTAAFNLAIKSQPPPNVDTSWLREKHTSEPLGIHILSNIPEGTYPTFAGSVITGPVGGRNMAMYLYPIHLTVHTAQIYIGALINIYGPTTSTTGDSLTGLVTRAVMGTPVMRQVIAASPDPNTARLTFASNVLLVAHKVRPKGKEGRPDTRHAVYVASPYGHVREALPFADTLVAQLNDGIALNHSSFGHGKVNPDEWLCSRCSGNDHPATSCPYPRLEGWTGAPPVVVSYADDTVAATPAADPYFDFLDGEPANGSQRGRSAGWGARRSDRSANRGKAPGRGRGRGRGGRGRGGSRT